MKIIKALNNYFIADDDEYIPASDFVWFYGTSGIIILLGAIVWIF